MILMLHRFVTSFFLDLSLGWYPELPMMAWTAQTTWPSGEPTFPYSLCHHHAIEQLSVHTWKSNRVDQPRLGQLALKLASCRLGNHIWIYIYMRLIHYIIIKIMLYHITSYHIPMSPIMCITGLYLPIIPLCSLPSWKEKQWQAFDGD